MFFSRAAWCCHLAIKSFDLVMALTAGGPGYVDRPARHLHVRVCPSRAARSAWARASAMMMLATVAAIVVPYLYPRTDGAQQ